jgi:hypothetical protein
LLEDVSVLLYVFSQLHDFGTQKAFSFSLGIRSEFVFHVHKLILSVDIFQLKMEALGNSFKNGGETLSKAVSWETAADFFYKLDHLALMDDLLA